MPLQVLQAIGSDRNPYTVLVFEPGKNVLDGSAGERLFRLSSGHMLAAGADAGTFWLVSGQLQLTLIDS